MFKPSGGALILAHNRKEWNMIKSVRNTIENIIFNKKIEFSLDLKFAVRN
jgi:hypothetical protein